MEEINAVVGIKSNVSASLKNTTFILHADNAAASADRRWMTSAIAEGTNLATNPIAHTQSVSNDVAALTANTGVLRTTVAVV